VRKSSGIAVFTTPPATERTGVAILYGRIKLHGFVAWWLWRMYYLSSLPTASKKLKVMVDWTIDFLFKPDVAMIKRTDLTTSDIEEERTDSIANK
jgi:hypothetical protein